MVATVTPFLMFQGDAEAAMHFYAGLIPDSRIVEINRYGAGESGPAGTVKTATICVGGQTVRCVDSPIRHNFDFTPSFSFFVDCQSEDEFERLVAGLSEGGSMLMSPDNYGFSRRFAWLNDRFRVSWQLNLQ
jgi:predicted 3-demethylubiquinone-9 3-methyltransferase (glyoxalase superfamily)